MPSRIISLGIAGLHNSNAPAATPDGYLRRLENATVARGVLEGGAGVDVGIAPPVAGSVPWGLGFARYGSVEEILGVFQSSGESTARLYRMDPSVGTWSLVETGLVAARWTFAQYLDRAYGCAAGSPVYRRLVGSTVAPSRWEILDARLDYGGALGPSIDTPDAGVYAQRKYRAGDLAKFDVDGSTSDCTAKVDVGEQWIDAQFNGGDRDGHHAARLVLGLAAPLDMSAIGYLGLDLFCNNGAIYVDGDGGAPPFSVEVSSDAYDPSSPHLGTWQACTVDAIDFAQTGARAESDVRARALVPRFVGMAAVKKIRLSGDININSNFQLRVRPSTIGGADIVGMGLAAPGYAARAVDYAFRYESPDGTLSGSAILATLGADVAQGGEFGTLGPIGATVALTATVNATFASRGYTRIRVYRKRLADGTWRRVADVANSGEPKAIDGHAESELAALPSATLQTAGFPLGIQPTAAAVWKQHLVLAADRKLYYSEAGDPTTFAPPPEEDQIPPTYDAGPRTQYLAMDRAEDPLGFASGDILYAAGSRTMYAIVGDTALSATPPRAMPDGRGPIAPGGMIEDRGAAMVAALDGLWGLEASRADTGTSQAVYRSDEATAPVRASWRALASQTGPVTLLSFRGELWAFRGSRGLRLAPPLPDGRRVWEERALPSAAIAAVWAPGPCGSRLLTADGYLRRLAYDASGAPIAGGETFTASTGLLSIGRARVVAVRFLGEGTPTVTITARDGRKTAIVPVSWTGTVASGRTWFKFVALAPAQLLSIDVVGIVGRDVVYSLEVSIEDDGPGYGN